MSVTTTIGPSGKYLVCRVDEPVTAEVVFEMIRQLDELAEQTGIRNRFIDSRGMPNMMSVTTNYDLAYKDMEKMKIDRSTKIASMRLPTDAVDDFASTAIKNAGFNLRMFVDDAEAIAWLESDED
jgi:predicted glycoside hydrolase/deacetylase ChbG (UPF0249 family)